MREDTRTAKKHVRAGRSIEGFGEPVEAEESYGRYAAGKGERNLFLTPGEKGARGVKKEPR